VLAVLAAALEPFRRLIVMIRWVQRGIIDLWNRYLRFQQLELWKALLESFVQRCLTHMTYGRHISTFVRLTLIVNVHTVDLL